MTMTDGGLWQNLAAWDPAPLRKALREGGFQHESLASLGLPEHWLRSVIPRAALLGHAPEGSPVETLLRLFTLGDAVNGELALHVLGPAIHGLLEIGFLSAGGGVVRSHYQICPIGSSWLACDFQQRQQEDRADYVMGIGPSSVLLSSLTPRDFQGRALELACGIGWLAGNLANSGMNVVATDLNARALELGRFSAKLSDIDSIDFRHGDGFSTVAGEQFDLIVSNLPYVQSPGGNMTYRESPSGDSLCARLLGKIPAHLAPDGLAIVLINWTHADDDDWTLAPLSWVPAAGTRRWLFQSDCASPADYAWKWISTDLRFRDEEKALAEMKRWLAWYRQIGANRISGGFMVIRKCAPGGEWTRTDSRAPEDIGAQAGVEILRIVRNETWLATDPPLLDSRFTVPDGVLAEARMTLGPAGWNRETIRLTSPERLSYDGQIDENILRLLALVREGKSPAAMVEEILGRPQFAAVPGIPERITGLVRELVAHGMLVPA
jgi:methylase of polypeptide subunit release factors